MERAYEELEGRSHLFEQNARIWKENFEVLRNEKDRLDGRASELENLESSARAQLVRQENANSELRERAERAERQLSQAGSDLGDKQRECERLRQTTEAQGRTIERIKSEYEQQLQELRDCLEQERGRTKEENGCYRRAEELVSLPPN